jgi:hypothetical protein
MKQNAPKDKVDVAGLLAKELIGKPPLPTQVSQQLADAIKNKLRPKCP